MESGVGNICCSVVKSNIIYFPLDNLDFTMDYALKTEDSQANVYEKVGKSTVEDILNGYNGTIIAYGQTGSGKTHTMFGPDMHNDELKGIIPRAAFDIFNSWETKTEIKEVGFRCSMLEIYQEDLRDLLTDESVDLKIKESPSRGIYVEGLREIPIVSEEEFMYWVDIGEARRVWAETRHNAVSSRSHTLVVLEVGQTMIDDKEKKGILNLVDLAGSEKVGKSGAQGQEFKEGTKINLSLSALGNVIHALTANLEHIPYRDSKLTRLLQESLGGNYKTTLIVTISPHSSEMQESISTLKFAQRAKKLKNRVVMNVKNSPDELLRIIQDLRRELNEKNEHIQKLTGIGEMSLAKVNQQEDTGKNSPGTCKADFRDRFKKSQSLIKMISIEPQKQETPENHTENTGQILEEAKNQIENLRKQIQEMSLKLRKTELDLIDEKKKTLEAQKRINELESKIAEENTNKQKEQLLFNNENIQKQIYQNQIKILSDSLNDAEMECFKLLKEKKEKRQKTTFEMYDLNVIEYVKKFTLQPTVI